MHQYELRKLENNGTATTVEEFIKEPKDAKRKAKAYAKKKPGPIYAVQSGHHRNLLHRKGALKGT